MAYKGNSLTMAYLVSVHHRN